MNKLIDRAMESAVDIMNAQIERNREVIDSIIGSVEFPCPDSEDLIKELKKDNIEFMMAIETISSRKWGKLSSVII